MQKLSWEDCQGVVDSLGAVPSAEEHRAAGDSVVHGDVLDEAAQLAAELQRWSQVAEIQVPTAKEYSVKDVTRGSDYGLPLQRQTHMNENRQGADQQSHQVQAPGVFFC